MRTLIVRASLFACGLLIALCPQAWATSLTFSTAVGYWNANDVTTAPPQTNSVAGTTDAQLSEAHPAPGSVPGQAMYFTGTAHVGTDLVGNYVFSDFAGVHFEGYPTPSYVSEYSCAPSSSCSPTITHPLVATASAALNDTVTINSAVSSVNLVFTFSLSGSTYSGQPSVFTSLVFPEALFCTPDYSACTGGQYLWSPSPDTVSDSVGRSVTVTVPNVPTNQALSMQLDFKDWIYANESWVVLGGGTDGLGVTASGQNIGYGYILDAYADFSHTASLTNISIVDPSTGNAVQGASICSDGGATYAGVNCASSAVPEPGTWTLIGLGLVCVAAAARRRLL